MIVYAIPFRAPQTANNWEKCVECLEHTLQSIFNPANHAPFYCIVACNQIPDKLRGKYDKRLIWIELNLPAPGCWIEMAIDKFWKLTEIAVYIRKILEEQAHPEQGIYVMPVDADDLLNYRIPEYCVQHPDENGFVSKDGYIWQEGNKFFRIYPQLHTYCGSCNIIKMYLDDLPEDMPFPAQLCHDQETAGILNSRYPIRYDHHTVVARYKEMGRPFAVLPFRSTVYVRGTGDNISCIPKVSLDEAQSLKQKDRFHPIAFLRSINIFRIKPITNKIKKEFRIKGWA